jgi:serine-type D-Ala-D-Ala carboxypeptidase
MAAFGRLSYAPNAPHALIDTPYDLASLTKVLVTTTLVMQLVDAGRLEVEQPLSSLLPGFQGGGRERVTLGQLLDHSSGLPAQLPLYRELRGREAFLARLLSVPLEAEPGTRSAYSDPGFLLLGAALEAHAGAPLDVLAGERILGPLGLAATGYCPAPELCARIAPTEEDPWRGRLLQGEVHDENAWALGGVAPHAGLFGSAPDLARFARCLLAGGSLDGVRLVREATLRRFVARTGRPPGTSRALGWDTPSGPDSSAGRLMSTRAFGHLGFVGTSLWIDPEQQRYVLLLANRVHPTRAQGAEAMRAVRAAVADAAQAAGS